MSRLRTGLVVAAAAAVALSLTSCGLSGVTGEGLNAAVGTSFAHLYVLQQNRQDHPPVTVAGVDARAVCDKGGPATPDAGAGQWQCVITWQVAGAGTPAQARYQLKVSTDGRFTADGDGPREVNEQQDLVGADGQRVTNPLWQFDGVVDTS